MGERITMLAGVLLLIGGIAGRAEQIAPGVEYSYYDEPGPNRVYVVRIDRLRSEYDLQIGWPQHKRNFTSRQTVSKIASLYDSPPEQDVLAAVNASFFSTAPSITGPAASGGEILEQPSGSRETFLFGPSRLPMILEATSHIEGRLTFADGSYTALHGYNRARGADTVLVYTSQWAPTTGTGEQGIEVVLADVSYPMRSDKELSGVVTAVRTGAASLDNAIPAGGLVISAVGTPATTIADKVRAGDRLSVSFDTSSGHWNKMDMAITGAGWLLTDGADNTANWAKYGFSDERHPRTVLAWNSMHLFMMVCDGRCTGSVGMTFPEMADFLRGTLGATDALNLDGGGSSTMWVNGGVRNIPSDSCGTERAVANAVMLVRRPPAATFPFADPFGPAGRLPGWSDKFRYNRTQAFDPPAPLGEGYAICVRDLAGGVETVRRGDFGDTDYYVEADIYCQYRPEVAGNGYERYCLFARDDGVGGLGLTSSYGPGNCYALTFDSNNGRVRAGRYVNGALTDFREATRLFMPSTAWRRFRIECYGSTIRYFVDGVVIAEAADGSRVRGFFGIGYHEFFSNNVNILGTRADNLAARALTAPSPATDPQPADRAAGVPLDTVLRWTAGTDAASHDVYFGLDGTVEFRTTQTGTTFDPGPLQLNRTYSWRVDEVNGYGTTTGPLWQFRTHRYMGDYDDDADVDQEDFGRFQICISGIAIPQLDAACERARLEPVGAPDLDVDESDLAVFISCMGGPGVRPASVCLE